MRVTRIVSAALVAVFVILPTTVHVLASDASPANSKRGKKAHRAPAPASPAGVGRKADPTDAYYGGTKVGTITEYTNDQGQTIYSIAASHFDISPPLSDLAAAAPIEPLGGEEEEAPTNPMLPSWRIIRSGVPDPVVQPVVQASDAQTLSGAPLAAPTTGFNFAGVPINGGTPSDSNGSVGNNQFVETVNTRYQVWSLNRATQTATPLLLNGGVPTPVAINTLWSGFGGACETQNSGDPIVLYDKPANRWLISQFTSSASNGVYYQCVAVSTSANATGTYARWAFAVPSGKFGDYPHISVWSDAYYMMAHGFGGTFAALFAAMDRTKMIAGNAAATWIVLQDPNEGGHMPADMDGFAYPPIKAPGIFLSLHPEGMYIYRMKVNFASPGSTARTLQAIVPVAPANAACGGGTCIPQPGTAQALDSIADRLMFRAAYRNFIDHESIVVTHSVDPGVSGVVSGVRWYDFRISGSPNATCPTYPCVYQQGTIADVDNGRSRWMSSIAMDSAENILVGYSTTGKTAGTENHSMRYTGRAKTDPPGTMTAPEATLATGTANNASNSRWGDYSSMSIDPADDCTFWYTSQYFTTTNQWSTRIASAVYPSGTGAGQCQATTCTTRPSTVPLIGTATTPADNQIAITWGAITPTPGAYDIERAEGACGAEGLWRPLTSVPGNTLNYLDTTVQAGVTYAYHVRGATDAAGRCVSQFSSGCVNATATGNCVIKPTFAGASSASSNGTSSCGVTVNWSAGSSGCALAPSLRYNVFRGTVPDFAPSAANRIATCVTSSSSYVDTDNLQSGTTYYYVVRAEDSSSGNGGDCGGGNEETNTVRVAATPYAAGLQSTPGTWTDGGGDGSTSLLLNPAGGGNTPQAAWRIVRSADDPGANHTPSGSYAYRNAGPGPADTYTPDTCAELQAPSLTVGATSVNLEYWERHQVEYHWDGVAVEYSVNGGAWNDLPAPSNSAGDGCDPADDTTGWETLSCTGSTPANACGYPASKNLFTGPSGGGSTCSDFSTGAVTPYAHRCHQVTGLSSDDDIRFRWRLGSDSGAQYAGFYLDDIAVTNVKLPNACTPNTCVGQADGTSCSDGNSCTLGDACSSGACSGTPVSAPAETANLTADPDKATYSWSAVPGATRYDAVRGSLSALPMGPGGGDETCFDDLASPTLVDPTVPDPGTGFFYLSRGENACALGSFGQQSNGTPRVTSTCP